MGAPACIIQRDWTSSFALISVKIGKFDMFLGASSHLADWVLASPAAKI